MNLKIISSTFLWGWIAVSFPAHAIKLCPTKPAENSVVPDAATLRETAQVGQLLGGTAVGDTAADTAFKQYASKANAGWQAYSRRIGTPLTNWAAKELRVKKGGTVFYPFSGPDLPTVMAMFPDASRYILVSIQPASNYFDPFTSDSDEMTGLVQEFGDAWTKFGALGYFRTHDLDKGIAADRKVKLGPSLILPAFAVRLGFEVRTIRPVCLGAGDLAVHPLGNTEQKWGSVRMELQKAGRNVIVDYIQQDLSDEALAKQPETTAFIGSIAKSPTLLKAASHLLQQRNFAVVREAILKHAPMVVQDETGLEYDALATVFNIKLYGNYVSAHKLFKVINNPSLAKAYSDMGNEVKPIDFKLGYEKKAGTAIQIAIRK
ncbi:hypothetical protein [Chitinimonas sp. BJB300]|uniref:hypothetical protein n=1 Tax=Chitinimonas sp. BJB300 TaxID=1559339 RepID=UPI000C0D580E|nr:hypothetical protein [Chitinimonas sp. BJB300]PHV13269.1 hypothetical protein CSQ89_01110 [Chitinimonas sp. BJB300]TSJ86027.1 hypothetical protein FG002_016810 [Chitinimonas sp. BJB300]